MKKLLIVESPAKAKTIGKYLKELGEDFTVLPSVGHIRDLPKKTTAITIKDEGGGKWSFDPKYAVSPDKKKIVQDLKEEVKKCSAIYLAPDPDREGEAIAWHLKTVLEPVAGKKPFYRVAYNEITKAAVGGAIRNPGQIDMARVDAQQARRIIDRIVGYKVSPLLWRYLPYGYKLSAGRVQSVALRLLVEREREISSFVPEKYWLLGAEVKKQGDDKSFIMKLARFESGKPEIKSEETNKNIMSDLENSVMKVSEVRNTERLRKPAAPFTTSTLQQAAASSLGFSAKRTMSVAQALFEQGFITYLRTDSPHVSKEAQAAAKAHIIAAFGEKYYPASPNFYKAKAGMQEAHEAIRPTDVNRTPDKSGLSSDDLKLYDLIWKRFVASQMAPAVFNVKRIIAVPCKSQGLKYKYEFSASASAIAFDGCLRVLRDTKEPAGDMDDEVESLPEVAPGEALDTIRLISDMKETKPPARYSEGALVKALEGNGVGRPSTYAQTIETLLMRQYAKREKHQLIPTQRGMDVNDWLVSKLDSLFAVNYTAGMERDLDEIEEGRVEYASFLSEFYNKFLSSMEAAKEPPPSQEKFDKAISMMNCITKWNEPAATAKSRKRSDREFVESIIAQKEKGEKPLSERQLAALASIALKYIDQIPNGAQQLEELGYGKLVEETKNAPDAETCAWCLEKAAEIPSLEKNAFVKSIRRQFESKKHLSTKQFSALAKIVGSFCSAHPDCAAIREKLAQFVPGGFTKFEADPDAAPLIGMLENVTNMSEAAKNAKSKRRTGDKEFFESLKSQFETKKYLSAKQVTSLRKLCLKYSSSIPGWEEKKNMYGLDKVKASTGKRFGRRKAPAK